MYCILPSIISVSKLAAGQIVTYLKFIFISNKRIVRRNKTLFFLKKQQYFDILMIYPAPVINPVLGDSFPRLLLDIANSEVY